MNAMEDNRPTSKGVVALLGSADTKKEEMLYTAEVLSLAGCETLMVDLSLRNLSRKLPGITPLQILQEISVSKETFLTLDKQMRVETMREALEAFLPRLYEEGGFQGVLMVGGGQNARMAADAMKRLPFGVPKILASALICGSRELEQFTGTKDIFLVHTVADVAGLNDVTRTVIRNVCFAMAGMLTSLRHEKPTERKRVATTALGVTSECADGVRKLLTEEGYEVTCFHANGVGGRGMEELAEEGGFDLVADLNLHEVACELLGGYCSGADRRLEKTMELGLPMVVVPGAADMIDYYIKTPEEAVRITEGRKYVFHNSHVLHVKFLPEEAARLGRFLADRLNQGTNDRVVILPGGGLTAESVKGQPLYDPSADARFFEELKAHLKKEIPVIELEEDICSERCQEIIAENVNKLLKKERTKRNEKTNRACTGSNDHGYQPSDRMLCG